MYLIDKDIIFYVYIKYNEPTIHEEVSVMYRSAIEELYRWKQSKNKKLLIIRGARQVGKTWLLREFGKIAFEKVVYISFDNNQQMKTLFSYDLNVERIVTGLELYTGHKINPANTLLIFDEVQEVPQALTSLKYFNETAPEYQILCAGSLLGVALHEGTSFPVGKVEFLDLHPLSYFEFIQAMAREQYVELVLDCNFGLANTFKQEYIDLLKYYFYVGGMPEAVQAFSSNKNLMRYRKFNNGF